MTRYRLRIVCDGHWCEGTWTADTREEAEQIAREWAVKWWRHYTPLAELTIEDGQT